MPPNLVGAPPLPNAFNNKYESQVDHVAFTRSFGWARGGGGSNRTLRLIAMVTAPYSTPADRQAVPDPARLEQAITYLFSTPTGLPRPNGIPRYRPANNNTFCNIFANDILRIFHCEIPNNPANTTVGQMRRWLDQNGAANGWRQRPANAGQEAKDWVNAGRVAVVMWSNDEFRDHVALVRPGQGRVVQGQFWPRLAQAGTVVSADVDSFAILGQHPFDMLRYYLHD